MKTPTAPEAQNERVAPPAAGEDKPDTNEVQHDPDPKAEPIPGAAGKWHPKSPYTTGND